MVFKAIIELSAKQVEDIITKAVGEAMPGYEISQVRFELAEEFNYARSTGTKVFNGVKVGISPKAATGPLTKLQ